MYMVSRLVGMQLLCCSYMYLLLLLAGGGSVVNGFTQVTGSAMFTSQCGVQQDDPQLVAALRQVKQLMVLQDATFPELILHADSSIFPISFLRLLQDPGCQ